MYKSSCMLEGELLVDTELIGATDESDESIPEASNQNEEASLDTTETELE